MSTIYEAAQALKSQIENGTVEDSDCYKFFEAIGAKEEVVDRLVEEDRGPALIVYVAACSIASNAKAD